MQTMFGLMKLFWCITLFSCIAFYIWDKFISKMISCFFVAPFDYDEPDRSLHSRFKDSSEFSHLLSINQIPITIN